MASAFCDLYRVLVLDRCQSRSTVRSIVRGEPARGPCRTQVREQMEALVAREAAAERYAAAGTEEAAFPPAPPEVDWEGELLSQWVPDRRVIEI